MEKLNFELLAQFNKNANDSMNKLLKNNQLLRS
jgi:hypothetical protein